MRIFACPVCGGPVYFANTACACGAEIAFDPERHAFATVFAPCANRAEISCNWGASGGASLCRACAMTETIPDAFHGRNREFWADAELAKRWVLANLGRWGWLTDRDTGRRPIFRLLAEETSTGGVPVTMGHASGVVTINVTEADPAVRVSRRRQLGEPYRTMPGHFRHELGHFFFERLGESDGFLPAFRATFGDESPDYGAALARYYAAGPPRDWRERHVSAYATAHPHEDWAEHFAHLLHLTDIVDSFAAAGLHLKALPEGYDAYAETSAEALVSHGAELGIALNHVNRSMGLPDLYPFILTPTIRQKLAFVHGWLRRSG